MIREYNIPIIVETGYDIVEKHHFIEEKVHIKVKMFIINGEVKSKIVNKPRSWGDFILRKLLLPKLTDTTISNVNLSLSKKTEILNNESYSFNYPEYIKIHVTENGLSELKELYKISKRDIEIEKILTDD